MTATLTDAATDLGWDSPAEAALVASAGGPDVAIEAMPAQAAPPVVSLLSTAIDVTDILTAEYGTGHWYNGLTFEPEGGALDLEGDFPYFWTCPTAVVANPSRAWAEHSPGGVKQVPDAPDVVTYRPYVAHTADPCVSTFGMFGRDAAGRARRLLDANLSRILEDELWTGTRSQQGGWGNNYFMLNTVPMNIGALTGFISALSELEQGYAALDNRPGFIHCQPRVAALWKAYGLIEASPSGKQLRTILGNYVIPGVGYPGTAPGGGAATHGESTAFMTGPIMVARSPIREQSVEPAEMVLRTTNTMTVRAEVDVAAFWDGKVDICVLVNHLVELS